MNDWAERYPWALRVASWDPATLDPQRSPVPREAWPPGPWHDEPDIVEWRHESGLPCLIVRAEVTGSLCGYVGVPPGHPLHGKGPSDVDLDAHGGITYADACQGSICHVPRPGEPDDVWWFGFDTAHAFDVMPAMAALLREKCASPAGHLLDGHYWTVDDVRAEADELAAQLVAAAGNGAADV